MVLPECHATRLACLPAQSGGRILFYSFQFWTNGYCGDWHSRGSNPEWWTDRDCFPFICRRHDKWIATILGSRPCRRDTIFCLWIAYLLPYAGIQVCVCH